MKNNFILLLLMLMSGFAMATPTPVLKQSKYRWRNNNGDQATATWKAAENTAITLTDAHETLRLRTEYYCTSAASTVGHFIAYSKDAGTTWITVNETDTNDFMLTTSTLVTHGTNTTNQLGTSTGGTFAAGKVVSQDNPSMSTAIAASGRIEMEWVIKPTIFAQNNTTYLFESRSINTTGTRAVLNTNFNCTMPVLTLPPTIERCGAGTVQLAGNVNAAGATIIWRSSPTSGILGVGTTITSPFYSGNTTVYAKATKNGCTTAGQSVGVVINSIPSVNLGQDLDTCIFAANTINLNAGPQPAGTNVEWDDNSTNLQRQITHSGTYYVRVTNVKGCIADDTIKIVMREKPEVNLDQNGNSLCIGNSLELDAGPGGQNGGSYYWNTGELTQTISVNDPGTYIVQVTASNNCSSTDTVDIVANGYAPSVRGIIAVAQGGSTFEFTAVNPQHVDSYQWDFGDGSTPSTIPNPTYSYAANGVFNARLKVSSTCADAWDSIQVNIFGVGINGPGADNKLFNVYPNPNKDGHLNIEVLGTAGIENITVVSLSGQELARFENINKNQSKHSIYLPASLSAGIYNLVIKTDKGAVIKKINLLR